MKIAATRRYGTRERNAAFAVWRERGRNFQAAARFLQERKGWSVTRDTLARWGESHRWEEIADRLDAEERESAVVFALDGAPKEEIARRLLLRSMALQERIARKVESGEASPEDLRAVTLATERNLKALGMVVPGFDVANHDLETLRLIGDWAAERGLVACKICGQLIDFLALELARKA